MASPQRPVVLIPGFTGSRLTTRRGGDDAYPTWIDLTSIFGPGPPNPPVPTPWWIGEMLLAADGMTPVQSPADNKSMTGLEAISTLDPAQGAAAHYFYELIARLQAIGYDDTSLQAAPYDWRLPPIGLERRFGYFSNLKVTIERMVATDPQHRPAVLVGHSLGNRIVQYFLQLVLQSDPSGGQAWIDRFVGRYLAVSALWLGVPKSIHEAVADLGHLGIMTIPGVKPLYQSYGALPWMFPVTEAQYPYLNTTSFAFLGGDDRPLTIDDALKLGGAARTRDYRRAYYAEDPRFTAPGGAIGSLAVLPPPVADTHVLYATGQPTEVGAYYVPGPGNTLVVDADATSDNPNFVVQDGIRLEVQGTTKQRIDGSTTSGDGFLPYGSLMYFTTWLVNPSRPVSGRGFPGRTHYDVLRDPGFLDAVQQLVSS